MAYTPATPVAPHLSTVTWPFSTLTPASSRPSPSTLPVMPIASRTFSTWIDSALPSAVRSEEHTSELQSLMRISYAVFCLKKQNKHVLKNHITHPHQHNC